MHRLIFLHGFTQTHHHWHGCADRIARRLDDRAALAFVDLPGHGLAADDTAGTIDDSGPQLLRVAGRGTYVGYSMGGRMALVAAASANTGDIERLVLIGATAGLDDPERRAARRAADDRLADRLAGIGVDRFLDEWLANPLFATLPPDAAGRRHRAPNTAEGLAHSLRSYGTGAMTPLWSHLADVTVPMLLLAGELDTKFTDIGERMCERLPDATFVVVPGAGHAAHAEAPEPVSEIIADWLSTAD